MCPARIRRVNTTPVLFNKIENNEPSRRNRNHVTHATFVNQTPAHTENRNLQPRHHVERTRPASQTAAHDAAAMPTPATRLRAARKRRGHRHPAGDDRLRRRRRHLHLRQTGPVPFHASFHRRAAIKLGRRRTPTGGHRTPAGLLSHSEPTSHTSAKDSHHSPVVHRITQTSCSAEQEILTAEHGQSQRHMPNQGGAATVSATYCDPTRRIPAPNGRGV